MAQIKALLPVDFDWAVDDELLLLLGSENVDDLAASTPAGGNIVKAQPVWPRAVGKGGFGAGQFGAGAFGFSAIGEGFGVGEFGQGLFGTHNASRHEIEASYDPTDVCAHLPVGVKLRDPDGNESSVVEALASIADPPAAPTDPAIASTGNKREARVSWTESGDV